MSVYRKRAVRDPGQLLLKLLLGALGASLLAAILVGGGLIVATQAPRVLEGWRSRSWPSAQATVLQSGAVQTAWKPRLSTRTNYGTHSVRLLYRYEAAGRTYVGSRRSLDGVGKVLTETGARAVVDSFPVGARIRVHYDPADPQQSLLAPGVPYGIAIATVLGALLFGAGALAVIAIVRGLIGARR